MTSQDPNAPDDRPSLGNRIKAFLLRQTDDPRRNLNWVISGAVLFFLGLGLVFYAEKQLPSSLAQELTALVGLACLSIGAILTACGYISLSLLRIFRFINDESDPKRSPPRH
ncbi:MAG: hypothetical protein V7707_00960 [Motiliproteus sp.]